MIRIKVYPLKKIIYKLEIIILLLMFLFTICISIILIFRQKENVLEEVISKKIVMKSKEDFIENILKQKLSVLNAIDYDDLGEEEEQEIQVENKDNIKLNNEIAQNEININIKEIDKWNKPDEYSTELYENGKVRVGNIIINNYSKIALDLNELKKVSKFNINDNTNFLFFHTHTSETYSINENEYSDYYRTQNEKYNMISVGDTLSNALKAKGYNCVHDKTVHDYPSYNGAYKASLKTVQACMEKQNFDFIIDIHRDAISSNEKYRPTIEINGESVAKLMFVVGTDGAGLEHDKWIENLKLAIMIQNRAEEMYPGLFRELHLSNSRYNQQVSEGALILEVGATGNTLEEAQAAMRVLAGVLDSMK